MSFTAIEIPSHHHTFGHTMVGTMARPLNGWVHEPFAAPRHHAGYYPPDAVRLPPPASLVSGAPSSHNGPNGREHHPARQQYSSYQDYQTPSPIQQHSPPLPPPSSEPHRLASIAQRRPTQEFARGSPTLSSTTSERSAEDYQDTRLQALVRDQASQQVPQPHHPVRHIKRPSGDKPYADVFQGKVAIPFTPPSLRIPGRSTPASPPSGQTYSPTTKTERVKISDLLSDEPRPSSHVPTTMALPGDDGEYKITVRQQPVAARSCGFGERDRRVIDPPPIVQLTIENPKLSQDEISRRIRHPFSVVHCSIWNETGEQDNSAMPEDYRQQRRLMGTLVSSPFVGVDENGDEGCFFCFPDLSCRTPGTFRLKFALVVLDPMTMRPGKRSPIRATAMSEVFTVYNAKDFPGMRKSTALTKKLKEQGCLISIKKGPDSKSHDRDDSDDDDNASSGGKRKRAKKN